MKIIDFFTSFYKKFSAPSGPSLPVLFSLLVPKCENEKTRTRTQKRRESARSENETRSIPAPDPPPEKCKFKRPQNIVRSFIERFANYENIKVQTLTCLSTKNDVCIMYTPCKEKKMNELKNEIIKSSNSFFFF